MTRAILAMVVFGAGFWLVVAIMAAGWAREQKEKSDPGYPRPCQDHREEGRP